jgi:transcriptional regulator with XRE-family HTH domain
MAAKNSLPDIIYYHRKQANLSRKALADLAGVGKTAIYDLENGKQTARWSTIVAVLQALNVTIKFTSPLMHNYEKRTGENARHQRWHS